MATNLTLKNNLNTEFKIEHKDNEVAKTIHASDISYTRKLVTDLSVIVPVGATLSDYDGQVVVVTDLNRGGTFIYDSTQSAVNNGGTIFDGWVRQYSGAVNVKWFGAVGDGDILSAIQNIIDNTTISSIFISDNFTLSAPIQFNRGNIRIHGNSISQPWALPMDISQVANGISSSIQLTFSGTAFNMTKIDAGNTYTTSGISFERIMFTGQSSSTHSEACFKWDTGGDAKFSRGFFFDQCAWKWFNEVFAFTQSTVTSGNTSEHQTGDIQITRCAANFNSKLINTGTLGTHVQINKFRMEGNDWSNNTTIGSITFFTGTVTGNIMEGHSDTIELISCRAFKFYANHFEGNTGEFIIKVTGDSRDGSIGPNYYGPTTSKRIVWLDQAYNVECLDKFIPNQLYNCIQANGLKYDNTGATDRSYGIIANVANPTINAIDGTTQASRQVSSNRINVFGATTTNVSTKLGDERVLTIPYSTTGSGLKTFSKTFSAAIGEYVVMTVLMNRETAQTVDPYIQFNLNDSTVTNGSWESGLNNFNITMLTEEHDEEILFTFFAKALVTVTSASVSIAPYGINPTAGLVANFSGVEIRAITNIRDIKHSLNLSLFNTGDAAPTSGNFLVGDTITNRNPTASGAYSWRCVASGNPGTWKQLTLDA